MAQDRNGNNHKAAGRPDGGQFDRKPGQGTDDDLEETVVPEFPAWDHIKDTPASREALLGLARTMSSWDGSCDWADASEPDELMSGLGFDPAAAMTLIDAVGDDYYPTREYVRFDDVGMLESVDEVDLEDQAVDEADDIRQYVEDTPEVREGLDADTLRGVRDGDPKALLAAARECCMWDGAFDWSDATDDIESLSGVYGSGRYNAQWLVDRTFFGDYEPGHDYIRFDGYGNFESVDESTLESEAWDNREEILDAVQGARDDMDFTSWTDDNVADMLGKLDVIGED